jgi:thiamine-phosphate pyrophosphorylase
MRPIVCMITAAIRGEPDAGPLLNRIDAAARTGVHVIQIRQPTMEAGALVRVVRSAVEVTRGTGARIVVNDRVDVALAAGAHGVHLKETSFDAARVRRVAPSGFVIGRSVHAWSDGTSTCADEALDYLLFGTVFESASKPGIEAAGLERLAAVCRSTAVPVLGVGGMTVARLADVADAGASGFAAIGLFADAPIEDMRTRVNEAVAAFDRH